MNTVLVILNLLLAISFTCLAFVGCEKVKGQSFLCTFLVFVFAVKPALITKSLTSKWYFQTWKSDISEKIVTLND